MDKKQEIDEEAIHWFVLLQDEDATDDDRARFQQWLNNDPAHLDAYYEIERLWGGLDLIPDGSKQITPAKLTVVSSDESISSPAPVIDRKSGRNAWYKGMAAACVVFTMAVGWHIMPSDLFADHRSGVGEHVSVILEDGSQVELGAETALNVDYSDNVRHVTLVRGEAFFKVTGNPERPFVVSAASGNITVLGTAFEVRMGSFVSVAVTEHTVSVSAGDDKDIRVTEGQQVYLGPDGVSPIEAIDPADVAAWRHNEMVFRDTPLEQVVAEIQRYRYGRIHIIGTALQNKRVTAVFDTRNSDAALDTIAQSLGLRLIEVPGVFTAIFAI
ncbi:FecR family protein [Brucellaceae bacterium C25G]